jgi:mono/diheme cytochrome c family protein
MFAKRTLFLSLLYLQTGIAVAAEADKDVRFSGNLTPRQLLEQHCFDCHGDGAKKGGFSLDQILTPTGAPDAHQPAWQKAWKIVRHGFMPPADADPIPEAERKALIQWIEEQQLGVNHAQPDPGRVTMRRLNRMEYEFTVSDLFGVDLVAEADSSSDGNSRARLRDLLPPDDTAFGFDNIGDFQTLSPALLENSSWIAWWYKMDRRCPNGCCPAAT